MIDSRATHLLLDEKTSNKIASLYNVLEPNKLLNTQFYRRLNTVKTLLKHNVLQIKGFTLEICRLFFMSLVSSLKYCVEKKFSTSEPTQYLKKFRSL